MTFVAAKKQGEAQAAPKQGSSSAHGGSGTPLYVQSVASQGVAGAESTLPHLDKIQQSFGAHDVSGVRAAVGGAGGEAAQQMGARAYTMGDRVAFKNEPDLRLAAHEAAHVVQQRGGVQLKGGVGQAGDHYERQADDVADAVVEGRSAEGMLGPPKKGGTGGVQMACASCGGGGGGCSSCNTEVPAVQMELDPLSMRGFDGAGALEAVAPAGGGAAKPKGGNQEGGGEQGGGGDGAAQPGAQGEAAAPTEDPISKVGGQLGALRCPAIADAPRAKAASAGDAEEGCHEDSDYFKPITAEQRAADEKKIAAGEIQGPKEPAGVDVKAESQPPQGNTPEESGGKPAEPETPKECKPDKPETPPPAPAEPEAQEEPMPTPSGPDPALMEAILVGEERRTAAVEDYDLGNDEARLADDQLGELGKTSIRFTPPGEDIEQQKAHARAQDVATRGLDDGVREARDVFTGLRPEIAQRITAALIQGKADIDLERDRTKGMIRGEFAAARASANSEAALSRAMVDLHFVLAVVRSIAATMSTATAIELDRTAKMNEAATIESEKLGALDTAVTDGQKTIRDTGKDRGEDAMKKGRSWHASYSRGRPHPKDGVWEGYVTDRRAAARADAAMTTATGFRDSFKQEAENQAFQVSRGKAPKCARIVATAFATRVGIAQNGTKFAQMVRDGLPAQIETLQSARTEFRGAIDKALYRQLLTLNYAESAQLQATEDTAYAQKLMLEQQAHAAATRLTRSLAKSNRDVMAAFATMRDTLEGREAPEEPVLARALDAARTSVQTTLSKVRDDIHGGIEATELSLAEQTFSGMGSLVRLGEGAGEQAREAASGFSQQMSGMRQRVGETFTNLGDAYQKQLEALSAAATKSFSCALASLRQTADGAIQEVNDGIKSVNDSLEKSFKEELGKVDAKIELYACKAAEKEQPAWKEVLAVILIIVIIIVAIIVFGPLALALSGGVAITMGGAIAAGVIIGALSAAATTILSNWADGQKWHKGVVKAMVVGAITGAIGGAFGGGAAGGWIGKAGSFMGQIGRQVVADFVGSMVGQVLGGLIVDRKLEMPHYSVKDFMMSVFMAALFARGKIPARMSQGPGARAKVIRGFEHVQEFAHNVAGMYMPGGRFRPNAGGKKGGAATPPPEAGRPGETAPTQATETPPAHPNERPGAPENKGPEIAREHGQPVERTGPETPRESLHDARASERTPHHDAPEVEPGTKVVAQEPSVGDHTVKITQDGKAIVCSTCGEIGRVFEPEIAEFGLQRELIQIEAMSNPQAKAAAAARLHAKLVGLRSLANHASGAPPAGGDPAGTLAKVKGLASEMRMPETTVAQHAQEIIKTGKHPEGVSPEGPYGQRLLDIAESIVGARAGGARHATPDIVTAPPPKPKLQARYKLTSEQNRNIRRQIDAAEARGSASAAEQLRFARKQRELINTGKEPYHNINEWRDIVAKRRTGDALAATQHADTVRPGLEQHFATELRGEPLISGDKPKKYEINYVDPNTNEPGVARPDSIAVDAQGKVVMVHDHKHMFADTKKAQVLADSAQLQAERTHAHKDGGTHVISMSSEKPNLNGNPPIPRPDVAITNEGSVVVYADPATGAVTHRWVPDPTGKTPGSWKPVK